MASINKVFLMGNLTRDPELRYTPGGAAVCEFGMAMNEKWKDQASGQMKEKVCFVDVTCWKRTAEVAAEYLKKGSPVHVEGQLTFDQWEDQSTGQKRSKIKVTCHKITFVGSKNGAGGQGQDQGAAAGTGGASEGVGQEEDIPF